MTDMSGKVVVVTGASAGVGRATAKAFAEQGARVALLARGEKGLEGARRDVEAAGGEALVVPTDVADAEQVEAAASRVEEEFGPIDVWVNDVMSSVFGYAWEITPEEYKRASEVTYLGSVYGTLAALKRMMPRDRGSIVQVGSAMAYRGVALQAPYCAAKQATRGFNESVRSDLIHRGSKVHVSIVHLPGINTPQYSWVRARVKNYPRPVPPVYQPEVAAKAIIYAANSRRREVWVGIPSVTSILGGVLTPELADRFAAFFGVNGQLTDEPINTEGRDNLYGPVDSDGGSDHGAHGRYDDKAFGNSIHLEYTMRRTPLLIGAAGAAAVAALLLRRR
jgi:NAD(P)-dependent dehydrogenase (short-subunit alcohol dehydrogenase family)